MYQITKGIHIHFAHVVQGHSGLCLGPHGHTWYFEVTLASQTLDEEGFVCDFSNLKRKVLSPTEAALDHAFAIGADIFPKIKDQLSSIGDILLGTRVKVHGLPAACNMQEANVQKSVHIELPQMEVRFLGSVKAVVFDFTPTSERLAKWLYDTTKYKIADGRISVSNARVYETLQPVESYAEYRETDIAVKL